MFDEKAVRDALEIELSQDRVALVDAEDFSRLINRNWSCAHGGGCRRYPRAVSWVGRKDGKTIPRLAMERVILKVPPWMHIDHINGNTLDNRKCNLRWATNSQNMMNRQTVWGVSKYLGVAKARGGKWKAAIKGNGKYVYLGIFEKEIDAAKAYNHAAKKYFGEFASPNEVPDENT